MRSRNISVSIILQNIAQLKALFDKQWESIMGNCDTLLYLGGNEQATHKAVSELLGKETIDTNTYGRSTGRNGNYSTNWQISGRELLTPDEVRMLDNRYALLFIRGERPIQDEKYDILRHPRLRLTTDGGKPAYRHGLAPKATASLSASSIKEVPIVTKPRGMVRPKEPDFTLLSEEDLEEKYHLNDKET
jgi:type IV secretion system protein VirD4